MSTDMTSEKLAEQKRAERELWARGDYGRIARELFWPVGARVVERTEVRAPDRVLDVACGTGNATIRAADAGAETVGLDLTPELLEEAARLGAEEKVDIDWVEGDVEELPFDDEAFDVVLSVFGCMFAPRQALAASEMARVLRPGGRIGICSWTPDSVIAELMRAMFEYVSPPEDGGPPPPLWGSQDHVRSLFEGTGVEPEFERTVVEFRSPSVEDALTLYETVWGPFMLVRETLEPQGRWGELRARYAEILERRNKATAGDLVYEGDYLLVTGRKR